MGVRRLMANVMKNFNFLCDHLPYAPLYLHTYWHQFSCLLHWFFFWKMRNLGNWVGLGPVLNMCWLIFPKEFEMSGLHWNELGAIQQADHKILCTSTNSNFSTNQKPPFYLDHISQSQSRCATAKTSYKSLFPFTQILAVDKYLVFEPWISSKKTRRKVEQKWFMSPTLHKTRTQVVACKVQKREASSRHLWLVGTVVHKNCQRKCTVMQILNSLAKIHRNTNSGQFGKMHRNTNIERFYNNRQYKANIGKINVMHHFAFW